MGATLLVLAAGMGSRYGGLKQIDPIGPNQEIIMDYSIYDAIRAGFSKVVFIIREDFAEEFKARFQKKLEGKIKVEYVYQKMDYLPTGIEYKNTREKPRGTGHAVWVAKDVINEPFAVITADDFYGKDAFQKLYHFLTQNTANNIYSLIAYKLENTLSKNGNVNRGIVKTKFDGTLDSIKETLGIQWDNDDKIIYFDNKKNQIQIPKGTLAAMSIYGFKTNKFDYLEQHFKEFLLEYLEHPTREFFLPNVLDSLNKSNIVKTQVIECDSERFGITYKEDKEKVISKLNKLIKSGEYPEKLF